jgi:cytochrome P450/NADPH-cytochrome P450 reductase
MRGCIGRPFAWQEAILCAALLLQNFNFRFDDPGYMLQIQQTATVKPKDFYMHAELRNHIDPVYLERMLHVGASKEANLTAKDKRLAQLPVADGKAMKLLTILYGSNSGTCEALAQALARVAGARGFEARVDALDSAVERVPGDQPVVMISSSYEGQPPDNAAHFVNWLSSLKGGTKLQGVRYAVFGCGNRKFLFIFAFRSVNEFF